MATYAEQADLGAAENTRSDSHGLLNGPYQTDLMSLGVAASAGAAQANFSPALSITRAAGGPPGGNAGVGLAAYGLGNSQMAGPGPAQRTAGPGLYPAERSGDGAGRGSAAGSGGVAEKALCTFFLRTGTCAYGDRCKFKHPLDRPPPQLNSRGYPLRADEPDCAHYLKKGWCAFGPTCKFNHPELAPAILNAPSAYSGVVTQPTAYVSTNAYPSGAVYSVQPSMPTLYYLPTNQQLTAAAAGGGVTNLLPTTSQTPQLFQQQALTSVAAPQLLYTGRPQGVTAANYSNVSSMAALQEAMQGLNLARGGAMGHLAGNRK